MLDAIRLYDLIYALAARNGREQALFGSCASLARSAFERSLACEAFPELWFELPLMGEPWFDLHALVHRKDISEENHFSPERCGGYPEVFAWFAQSADTRQLALSYDVGKGDIDHPAVQLLMNQSNAQTTCEFLAVAGNEEVAQGYRAFLKRLPEDWYACYTGLFPNRAMDGMRVECIPGIEQQQAYAYDPSLVQAHLQQVGLTDNASETLERLRVLADTPWPLEFQFDVSRDGHARGTFSASLRFPPMLENGTPSYSTGGTCAELMRTIASWGLVDDRWQALAQTAFAQRVRRGSETRLIYCFPAFIKLKWHSSTPVDCKAYLMAGSQEL